MGLKLLLAPFVDKHRGSALGPRRGWILPLQCLTALCVLAVAVFGEAAGRGGPALMITLAAATVLTAVLAATQDCATDGLAVELLDHRERGLGNGVQVAAYRLGMIVGGSALLVVFDVAGWLPTFVAMALLTVALFTVMMDASDERSAATDYTVQASVIVWATFAGAAPAELLAQAVGYAPHFLVAGAVCAVGAVALPWWLPRARPTTRASQNCDPEAAIEN